MVLPEDLAPPPIGALSQRQPGRVVAPGVEIPGQTPDQPAALLPIAVNHVCGQDMRTQRRVPRPPPRISRIPGVTSRQQSMHHPTQTVTLHSRSMIAQNSLHQPMHHHPSIRDDPYQAESGHLPHKPVERQQVHRQRIQRRRQQTALFRTDQIGRDRFRSEKRPQPQQPHRRRVTQPVHRHRPRRGDRHRIPDRCPLGQNLPGTLSDQLTVGINPHGCLTEPRPGLLHRQRQIPEQPRNPISLTSAQPRGPTRQQRHRIRPGQHVNLQRPRHRPPAGIPRGDQHMPITAGRSQQTIQIRRRPGIVDDHQPAGRHLPAGQQPDQHRHGLGGLPGHRHPQLVGQPGQPGHHITGLLGAHPPHHVIVTAMPVGVLHRQLGLTDPTQTVQRLREHRHRPRPGQPLPQPGQLTLTAGEIRVPQPRHTPDRQTSGARSRPSADGVRRRQHIVIVRSDRGRAVPADVDRAVPDRRWLAATSRHPHRSSTSATFVRISPRTSPPTTTAPSPTTSPAPVGAPGACRTPDTSVVIGANDEPSTSTEPAPRRRPAGRPSATVSHT